MRILAEVYAAMMLHSATVTGVNILLARRAARRRAATMRRLVAGDETLLERLARQQGLDTHRHGDGSLHVGPEHPEEPDRQHQPGQYL